MFDSVIQVESNCFESNMMVQATLKMVDEFDIRHKVCLISEGAKFRDIFVNKSSTLGEVNEVVEG